MCPRDIDRAAPPTSPRLMPYLSNEPLTDGRPESHRRPRLYSFQSTERTTVLIQKLLPVESSTGKAKHLTRRDAGGPDTKSYRRPEPTTPMRSATPTLPNPSDTRLGHLKSAFWMLKIGGAPTVKVTQVKSQVPTAADDARLPQYSPGQRTNGSEPRRRAVEPTRGARW